MPAKHYKQLFKIIGDSKLLKLQITVLFITTYIDWVLMPFLTKFEGIYLPVYMISFFMLIGASDGLLQPLFKKVKIYRIYLFVIILDLIQIISYLLIEIDALIFTYTMLSIFTFQAITFEVSRIHTIDFMKDEVDIKEYLMLRSFVVSSAIIAGAISAMILDYFAVDLKYVLLGLAIFGFLAVISEYKLYLKFKRIIQIEDTVIERQKTLLSEKINV